MQSTLEEQEGLGIVGVGGVVTGGRDTSLDYSKTVINNLGEVWVYRLGNVINIIA